jgi:hypothetical protein
MLPKSGLSDSEVYFLLFYLFLLLIMVYIKLTSGKGLESRLAQLG